jgi:hypothetical protein
LLPPFAAATPSESTFPNLKSMARALALLLAMLTPGAAAFLWRPAPAPCFPRRAILPAAGSLPGSLRLRGSSSEPILVFGASGTAGGAVCAAILARDPAASVHALVRSAAHEALPSQVSLCHGDMGDSNAVKAALARSRAKHVFLACSNGQHQVRNELNVVAAAEQSGVQSVVKLSTATGCLSPESGVGQAHLAIEEALSASSIRSVALLRANYFMQNLLKPGLVVGDGHVPSEIRRTGILRSHYANSKISMV